MTKQELIDRIYRTRGLQNGLTKRAVGEIIDAVFGELGDYFIHAKVPRRGPAPRFTYPGFGTFSKRQRSARRGRHPQTGVPIEIPASKTLSFAVGTDLKELLNKK